MQDVPSSLMIGTENNWQILARTPNLSNAHNLPTVSALGSTRHRAKSSNEAATAMMKVAQCSHQCHHQQQTVQIIDTTKIQGLAQMAQKI